MLLLIALTSFLTIALLLFGLSRQPPPAVQARAEALALGPGRTAVLPAAAAGRWTSPVGGVLVRAIRRLLPSGLLRRLERTLIAAGNPIDAGRFLVFWVVITIAMAALGTLLLGVRGMLLFGFLGAVLPLLWLRRVLRTRRRRIARALPDAMDLLVACVEAGLGLDSALIRVGEATDGPLGAEIRLTLGEISVGRARQEALLDLGSRTGVPDLDGFLRPIVQAERTGVSIGLSLRVEAEALRERRRQRAKEYAEKLPAKMVIPMSVFFIPAVLIVGVAAAFFSIMKTFSGL